MSSTTVEKINKASNDIAAKNAEIAEHAAKTHADTLAKNSHAAEHVAHSNTEALKKTTHAAQTIAKDNAEKMTQSGHAAVSGFQELAKTYRELATKNAETLTASITALAGAKTPLEFIALQQKLVTEVFQNAISDSNQIAKLTASAFAATFEPMQRH